MPEQHFDDGDPETTKPIDVEVATYKLSNINRVKLENLIHKFFEHTRLNIEIKDHFGKPVSPREWFLVPLFVIDEAVEKIKDGTIVDYCYVPEIGKLAENSGNKKMKHCLEGSIWRKWTCKSRQGWIRAINA